MAEAHDYWRRIADAPAIGERPQVAKLEALHAAGTKALVDQKTAFQHILLLETPKSELMLLLDGELQFYSGDEQRFHESLALLPALFRDEPLRRVGVMGGGDGLVARELLYHFGGEIERICVVDIDPAMTELTRTHPRLLELSRGSLRDPRVEVINADALTYRSAEPFDLILCDLPDPTSPILARLYNREFYARLADQLSGPDALLAAQIVYAPPLFDGVLTTLRSVFLDVREYAVWMYSFVRAGFALCGLQPLERRRDVPAGTRYLTEEALESLFYFAPDEPRVKVEEVSSDENSRVEGWYEAYLREYLEERILYF